MKALLLSAGKGARLGAITSKIPKPLIKIDGKIIERIQHLIMRVSIYQATMQSKAAVHVHVVTRHMM